MQKCKAITKSGRPCSQPAIGEDGCCLYHSNDPKIVEIRREAPVKGARVRAQLAKIETLPNLRTPREILKRCEELYQHLLAMRITPQAAAAACKLLEQARETYELILVEHRIKQALKALEGQEYLPASYDDDEDEDVPEVEGGEYGQPETEDSIEPTGATSLLATESSEDPADRTEADHAAESPG
jgi:hypothetical protein